MLIIFTHGTGHDRYTGTGVSSHTASPSRLGNMARTVVLVMTLISVSVLLLLAGNQRPTTTFRDYRPAASEIWATAAVAVSSAGDSL